MAWFGVAGFGSLPLDAISVLDQLKGVAHRPLGAWSAAPNLPPQVHQCARVQGAVSGRLCVAGIAADGRGTQGEAAAARLSVCSDEVAVAGAGCGARQRFFFGQVRSETPHSCRAGVGAGRRAQYHP